MTGIHGLEHVQSLSTTDFAHQNAVRAHPQSVDHEVPLCDPSLVFQVGSTRFHANDMFLIE